jgi:hypothetical protein
VTLKSFSLMLLGRILFGIGGESISVAQATRSRNKSPLAALTVGYKRGNALVILSPLSPKQSSSLFFSFHNQSYFSIIELKCSLSPSSS